MQRPPRPATVTVLGWIYVALAAFMFLAAAGGLATSAMMARIEPGSFPPEPGSLQFSRTFDAMLAIFQHFGTLCVVQLALAVVVLIAAVQFLQLRAWARAALEAFTWLGLIWTIAFGIYWMFMWTSMSSAAPTGELPFPAFALFGVVMGVIVMVANAVPAVVLIWLLRGATVRQAMGLQTNV